MKKLILLFSLISFSYCGGFSDNLQEVTFDFSGAEALVVTEGSTVVTTLTRTKALTTEGALSNLKKMLADGSLDNVIYPTEGGTIEGNITINSIYSSPVGDIVVKFLDPGIIFNGEYCWMVILNDAGEVSCIDPQSSLEDHKDIGQFFSGFYFDQSGNIYLDLFQEIYKWSREDHTISFIFDFLSINANTFDMVIAPDGSLVFWGWLSGENDSNFFRFYPSSEGEGDLEALCVYLDSDTELMPTYDDSNSFYFFAESASCSNLDIAYTFGGDSSIIKAEFEENGELTYSLVTDTSEVSGDELIKDSEGNIYVKNGDTKVTLISSSPFEEITFSTVVDEAMSEISGDYMFLTGTDSNGNRVLMRKHLLGDREEIDLLGGSNLLVQRLVAVPNGDAYFGALDLDALDVYLYKYNNTTSQLEQLDSLPSEVEDIIVL